MREKKAPRTTARRRADTRKSRKSSYGRIAGADAEAAVRAARGTGAHGETPGRARVGLPENPLGIYELHVTFNTRRAEAILGFYRDTLGFGEAAGSGDSAASGLSSAGPRPAAGPGEFRLLRDVQYLLVGIVPGASLGYMDSGFSRQAADRQGAPLPPEPSAAGLYFLCRDVEHVYRVLADRGVAFDGPPAEMPWGHRAIRTVDPEGRGIVFAEEPRPERLTPD